MRILRIDIIFFFIFLVWIDSAISRSPVKTARSRSSNTRKLSLDLSTANDPTELISRAFKNTLKDLKKQIQRQQPVTIFFFITPPQNSQEQYVDLIERTLRDLMAQWIFLPMQGVIRTEVKGNNDGTIANMTVIMSILPQRKTKTPNSEFITVDLSKPNVDMMQVLQQVLSISVQNPSIRLNGNMSNLMKLQIIPPAGTTKSSVHNIIGAIESILIKLLPDTEFSTKASISLNPNGGVKNIDCIVNLNQRRDNSFTFTVDISKTSQGLDNSIVNILKNIQQEVEVIFNENKPVFLSLKIKTPARSDKKTVAQTIDTVLTTLKKYFPNEIGVTAKIYENHKREITFVILDIVIEPKNAIDIDLTLPGGSLVDQVNREVSSLKDSLATKQPIDKTTSFTLILKPPANSDKNTIDNITHVIISTISRMFPDNEISFKTTATKDDRGEVTKLTLVITIEPNFSIESKKKEKVVHIDLLKPGSDVTEEVTKILPSLRDMLNGKDTTPITLNLFVLPPKDCTEEFMQDTLKTILFILTDNFPEDKITSEVTAKKNPQGFIQNMKVVITVTPSTCTQKPGTTETLNIDLTNSERDLVPKIINILPKLNKLIAKNRPANVQLIIQPPKDATDKTVQKFVKTIITILSKIYPYNKLEFQTKLVKNPQGIVENVTVSITIEPTDKNVIKELPDLPETINIDLKKPGTKLVEELINIFPSLKPKIKEKQEEGKPVNIKLNIRPPNKATTDYVKKTANTVLTVITKLFPNDDVKVKAKITKDKHGRITEVTFVISIDQKPKKQDWTSTPVNQESTTSKTIITTPKPGITTKQPNEVINIDLSRPGKNIPEELLIILKKIKKETPEPKEPISFQLNIEPPTGSNQKFVKDIVDTALTTLTTLYPSEKIKVSAKITKDSDHTIKSVSVIFVISPGNRKPEIGSTTQTPKNIHEIKIDVSRPGTNIPKEITNELIKIKPEVTKEIDEDQPLVLKIDIQPPKDSTEEFVKKTINIISTTASNLFPDKKIVVNVDAIKNPNGVITKLTVVLIIEPSTSTKNPTETTKKPGRNDEESTTPISPENKPSTPKETLPMKVHIDLSKPDTNLVNEVVNILPDIKDEIILKHPKDQPVVVEFNIKPSKKPDDQSVKETVKTIMKIITTVYPDNKISYHVKTLKDKHDTITNISLVVTFEPSSNTTDPFLINLVTLETTTGTEEVTETTPQTSTPSRKKPIKVKVDLSKPGSSLVTEILTVVPNIEKEVETKKPVQIVFQVKPSANSNEQTVKEVMKEILEILEQKFPEEKIEIDVKINKRDNVIDTVSYLVTIEPSSSKTTNIEKETTPYTTTKEITPEGDETSKGKEDSTSPEVTTTEENTFKESTNPSTEETISEESTTPRGEIGKDHTIDSTTETEPEEVTEETRPQKESTTPKEENTKFITTPKEESTTSSIYTTPSTKAIDETLTIDLTKPGKTLIDYIEEILPKVNHEIEPKLDKNHPVTLEFEIKPPKGSKDDYPKTTTETLVSILTKLYPKNKINVETKVVKTPDGHFKDVIVQVTIEPESTNKVTKPEETTTPFTTESSTMSAKEETTTEGLVSKSSTTETEHEEVTEETRPQKESTIPKEENTKFITTPNEETTTGSIYTTPSTKDIDETLTIDLTKPGKTLIDYIEEILPKVNHEIEPKLDKNHPVTLEFQIKPPKGSKDDYPKTTTETLVSILTKLYPKNKINVETKVVKTPDGHFKDVIVQVTIEPESTNKVTKPEETTTPFTTESSTISAKEETTTEGLVSKSSTTETKPKEVTEETRPQKESTTPKEENTKFITTPNEETTTGSIYTTPSTKDIDETLTIDLTKPGKTLIDYIEEILPKVNHEIEPKLDKNHPVTLEFQIKPPKGSKDDYPKTTTETLVSILTKLYPKNKINVETKVVKTPDGHFKDVIVQVTIEPESTNKVTKPEETTTPFTTESSTISAKEEPTTEGLVSKSSTTETEPEEVTEETRPQKESTIPKEENTKFITTPKEESTTSSIYTTPSTKDIDETLTIDLTKPGKTLIDYIEEILPKVNHKIEPKLDKNHPVTLEFKINPPKGSKDDYPKTTTETLVSILTKLYPKNKINVETKVGKTPDGHFKDVIVQVTIEPESTNKVTEPEETTTPFTTESSTISAKEEPTTEDLVSKSSTTETEPEEVTEETRPQKESTTPKEENTKFITTPKEESTTSSIYTTPSTKDIDETLTIDLTKPGKTLIDYIEEILPKVNHKIEPKLDKNHPVTLEFKINPPKGSKDDYPKTTTETLISILTKLYPKNKINVKTKVVKTPDGHFKDVIVQVTIEPESTNKVTEPEETTTPFTTESSTMSAKEETTTEGLVSKSSTTETEHEEVTEETRPQKESTIPKEENTKFITTPKEESTTSSIYTTPSTKDIDETLTIDLTKPGKTLIDYIEEILPKVNHKIEPKLDLNHPVTLEFKINPPKGSKDDYPKTTTETLVSILTKLYPKNKINVETKVGKTPDGHFKDVIVQVTIEPESTNKVTKPEETTTPFTTESSTMSAKEETTTEGLVSKSSTTETEREEVTEETRPQKESTIPKEENTKFMTTPKEESTTSSIYTTPSTKDIDETLTIDLTKPGKTLIDYIEEILPKVNHKIEPKLDKNHPVTLEFKINPPKGSKDDYPKTTTETLVSILTKLYPKNKINVETKVGKTPDGHFKDVIVQVTIEPESTNKVTEPEETTTPFTTESSTISAKEETTTEGLVSKSSTTETKPEEVTEETRPQKESTAPKEENTKFITTRKEESTTSTVYTTPSTKDIDESLTIDLTKPGKTLTDYIEEILPKINNKIEPKLDNNHPVTLEFEIKPPKGSKDDYPKTTTETLVSILKKLYPKNKINVETKVVKTPDGHFKDVIVQVTIEPESTNKVTEPEESTTTTTKITSPVSSTPSPKETDETWTIDLTKPGKTLTDYIEEILPKVNHKIEPKLDNNHPVTLEFKINPPKGSKDDYPKTTTETLISILTKLYPKNKINVKTKVVKTPDGHFKDVIVQVTIEPESTNKVTEPEETTTTTTKITSPVSSTPSPKETDETLTIDLTKPGKTLTDYIEEIIPKIFPKIEPKLDQNRPVTLEFVIKPPTGSNDDYPKTTTETLVSILAKLFPKNKISIKTKGVKTPDNQMKEVIVEVIIEPKSSEEVMRPSSTTPFTTSYITEKEEKETSPSKIGVHSTTSKEGTTEIVTEETKPWGTTLSTAPSTVENIFEGSTTTKREITTPETTSSTENENTTPSTDETKESTITIDISKPGKTLTDYVEEITSKIIPDVKPHLDENKPVILKFKLKPPHGSNENYPKETSEIIVSVLTKYFPDDKINVKTHKTPDDEIIFEIVIEPESSKKVTDSVHLVDETKPQGKSTFTPSTTSHIKEETGEEETTIPNNEPSTNKDDWVTAKTKPQDESYSTTLQTDENIFTKSTTPREEITETTTEGISGWFTEETRPEEKLSSIVPSTNIDDFKESTTPSEKITASVNFETVPEDEWPSTSRSSTGYTPWTITAKKEISQWTTPKSNEGETGVNVDLSKPGTNLGDKIEEIIANILPNIKPELEGKRPITLSFKITPPKGSDQVFLDLTAQTLISILTKYFPDKRIHIKTTSEKNPQGYLNEITIQVVIEPSKLGKPQSEDIDIDLSKPDSSLSKEISNILPGILPKITTELDNKSPVTLTFTIKPPNKTTESDLQTTIESLHEIITKYFPKNEVKVKFNAKKDPQGHIIQIIVQITIVPTTTTQEPTDENVVLDLSKPGVTLVTELNKILPNILPKVTKFLEDSKPVSISFRIKPKTGVTESYLPVITQTLESILTQYFPTNEINVNINAQKDSRDYLTEVVINVTVEPTLNKPNEENVTIDLSKPGTTLLDKIREVLPTILKDINDELSKKQPVNLEFKIKPPTGSTENDLQDISKTLQEIMIKYFPSNKISLKINANKDPQGYITLITVDITLHPSEITTQPEDNVDIDLTKPGSTLIDQVKEKMPNLLEQITHKLNDKHPVTLTFNIKPPTGSPESYLQDLTNSLETILTTYFPNNKIAVKLNAQKNPQGYITLVTLEMTLEPSPTSPAVDNNVDIDLTTPGSTLIDQVREKMPGLLNQITDKLNTKNPVTLTFKIKPPTGSPESYLQDLTNSVVTILTNYFPNNKILVKLSAEKNPQGYITLVTLEVTLEPSTTSPSVDNNVDIDLTTPGSNLIDQVREKMPGIQKQITDKLKAKNPVTLTFKIKPPTGSPESYLQDLTNSVETILPKYFPNNKIHVKLNAEKNPQGYITLVTIEITLEPSPTSPSEDNNVDIDLTTPGSTLIDQVREKMPGLLKQVTDKLNNKNPVTLTFKIKPPTGSPESYLQDLTNSVVTILTNYFPNNKILVKLSAEKNPQGYITLVTLEITLEPSTTSPAVDNNVDIDLTTPGSNLLDQVREKMPGLLKQITDKLNTKNPVTLTFKIKPPTGSPESYLQDLTNSVVTILTNYFPNNKILVKLSAEKNPQGYITLVTLEMTLEPSTTSPSVDNNVDIDLTTPGSNLLDQVREKMPGLLKQITDKLNTKNPVTLTFKIKPPTGSPESYLQDLTNSVVTILTNYFPNNKILVKLSAEKNPQGYITLVTLEMTLEPSTTSPAVDNNVDIDLTTPGSTLLDQVREKMPGLLKQITDKLNTKNPVTLTFKIKPPTGSPESYLQDLTNSVVTILTNYFPNNKILVKLSAEKNPQGYITLVTLEITLEPSTTSPAVDNNVDIDLTTPGSTLIDQVREKMPGLLKQITDKLNTKNPVTLTFKIKPPTGSPESYLQDLTNSVVTILTNYFPNNKILVKLSAEKNPQGYITLVTIEITLEPSSTLPVEENNVEENNVDIDLTKPGSTLIDQVREKMPNLLNQITSNLNNKKPVTLSFKIKPPNGSPESYLQDLTNSVVTIFTNYFPNNKIAVKLNAQKNSQGYLTLVTLEITLQPPSNPSTNGNDVDIDLAKPGVTLKDEIDKLLPTLKPKVTQELSNNRPVNLSFKIKPPKETTSSYLQVISETLQNIMTEYFPNNKVSLEISATKDSQGYITEITTEIKLEPSSSSLLPPDGNVDIDLSKPGVTLTNQISKIMPDILPNITKDLSIKKPVSLSFKIKPPPRSTQSYLQVLSESLEALLAKYLPNSQISVAISAQKDSQNYFSLITIEITIQPPDTQIPQGRDIEIDLTRPGANLNDQVSQYLSEISPMVSGNLSNGKSVNISIGVKPPHGSTDNYIQVIVNSLVPVLSKYFPGSKLNLETSAEKDSQGYISEILLIISIAPSSQTKGYTVDIDLANSRYTLVEQIDNIIPNIYQKIQDDLNSGESVSLSFKVLPPGGSRQDYLQTLTESLIPILSKFFPRNKMSVKTSASKNSQGYLDNITVEVTIVTQVQLKSVDIDLSRRGSTLQGEVSRILPSILPGLKSDLRRGKPITLKFNIRPPAHSTKSFLNTVTNQLVVILPQYFPSNRMSVKTSSTEDGQGFISDIVLLISIQP